MFKIGEGDNQCTQRSCVPKSSSTKRPPLSCTDISGSRGISIGTHSDPYGPSRSPEDVMCPSLQSLRHQTAPHSQPRRDENGPTQRGARNLITTNVHHACEILASNDFKILKVDFSNGLGCRCPSSARKGFYRERCLEPLKKCRAEKFLINASTSSVFASLIYAAELKAVIEGPKAADFQAYRKATEDEPESDYEGRPEIGDEEIWRLHNDDSREMWKEILKMKMRNEFRLWKGCKQAEWE
ncbi:MAG: hypothetical protein Q9175_005400 [Cornicularia normoerica]